MQSSESLKEPAVISFLTDLQLTDPQLTGVLEYQQLPWIKELMSYPG